VNVLYRRKDGNYGVIETKWVYSKTKKLRHI
jgi:hypothetical protein